MRADGALRAAFALEPEALVRLFRSEQRVRSYARGSGQAGMREAMRRAVARGDVDPAAVTDRRLESGHAMLRHQFITQSVPIPDHVIVEIVDEVVIPLLHLPGPRPG